MGREMTVTIVDPLGVEHAETVPSRNVVCRGCEGEGRVLTPSLRGAITQEEWEQEWDEEAREQYRLRGHGIYGIECPDCRGLRVVAVPDAKTATKRQLRVIRRWADQERDRRSWAAESAAEEHREMMMLGEQ